MDKCEHQMIIKTEKFKVLPQIVQFEFGDEQINLDEMVSATCTVNKGDLPLEIWWMMVEHDSGLEKKLITNDGVVITRSNQRISMLSIEAVKSRHRGNYTCYAKNKAGISQHSAQLAINGISITELTYYVKIKSRFVQNHD